MKKTKSNLLVLKSVAVSCFIAAMAFGSVYYVNKSDIQKGVGGLETSGRTTFRESDLDNVLNNTVQTNEQEDLSQTPENLITEELAEPQNDLCYYTYRVKKGDMIGYIADTFNVTQDTIISVNNIRSSRLLQIGQYLKIPSMPGIVYTVRQNGETISSIAKKYKIDPEKCSKVNDRKLDTSLKAGTILYVPDAQMDWITKQEINGDLFHKPLHSKFWISSPFGWRSSPFGGKRSYHTGVDMAAPMGTPIYAGLAGTVTTVGYSNVFGNYIIVTHHSGYKTLYAHMSATLVTKGKYVDINTKIGKVGSTGMSTGPHLHFTVYKNEKLVNPQSLWK